MSSSSDSSQKNAVVTIGSKVWNVPCNLVGIVLVVGVILVVIFIIERSGVPVDVDMHVFDIDW